MSEKIGLISRLKQRLILIWRWWRKPSHLAIGTLLLIGFGAGAVAIIGFNTSMTAMNSEAFCISCHEMKDNVYQEYLSSPHYSNRTGVTATCSDCHVPHQFIPKMIRKIEASKEVWSSLTGYISTPQKFEEHRLDMAKIEWKRLKKNGSQECKNCHKVEKMDFTAQKTMSQRMHNQAIEKGQTCIDCHKGIAHKLPDMKDETIGF